MPYTIKLENGKYLIKNDNGSLTILRHGEDWPAADDLKHVKILGALAARVEELEMAIRAVVDGEPDERGVRGCKELGMGHYTDFATTPAKHWEARLRNVLEQGE